MFMVQTRHRCTQKFVSPLDDQEMVKLDIKRAFLGMSFRNVQVCRSETTPFSNKQTALKIHNIHRKFYIFPRDRQISPVRLRDLVLGTTLKYCEEDTQRISTRYFQCCERSWNSLKIFFERGTH